MLGHVGVRLLVGRARLAWGAPPRRPVLALSTRYSAIAFAIVSLRSGARSDLTPVPTVLSVTVHMTESAVARIEPLGIQIATGDSRPISRQVVDAVRMKIATGDLVPGAQLPSVRGLAQQLSINPNTVAKAYSELTSEGWLESRQGLGIFVAVPRQRLSDEERERRLEEAVFRFINDVIALGIPLAEAHDRAGREIEALMPRKRA
jgi:GntR family transcriptional regulator